jgi:hypothetical protein
MSAMQTPPGCTLGKSDTAAMLWRAVAGLCLSACIVLAASAGNAQAQSRERITDNDALGDLLRDRTIHGVYSDGSEWIEYHAADGRSAYWDGCTHPGKWWVADGKACYRYPGDPSHVDHCWFIYREGERIEFVYSPDGVDGPVGAYSLEIKAGNPEHLPLNTSDCLSASLPASPSP